MNEIDNHRNPNKVKEIYRKTVEATQIFFAESFGALKVLRTKISREIREEVERNNYFKVENPNHNLRHIKDVVTLVNVFTKEMGLSTFNQIVMEITAWCHDLGHTGRKDTNYQSKVNAYRKEVQENEGRIINVRQAVEELKEKRNIDVLVFQPYESFNISSAQLIFVTKIAKRVRSVSEFTTRFPSSVGKIMSLISESFHPRFFDPKSKTGEWIPSDFGKIFRAADALPCFVWFKYDNEGRQVYFKKIIQSEQIIQETITAENSTYEKITIVNSEQSWVEQVVGIYLEEMFSGNLPMYERYVRRKDPSGIYMETLKEYFERVINDNEIESLSKGKIKSGKEFFLSVIKFERFYINVLLDPQKPIVPLYIEPAIRFYNEVRPLVLQDLDDIEEFVNQYEI